MRAVPVAALGFLAIAVLSGCDQVPRLSSGQSAALPPCHCVPAAAPVEHLTRLEAPRIRHHRHHRDYARSYSSHSYSQSWASEYEERSSSYSSQSRIYSEGDDYDTEEGRVSHEHGEAWVDGYGREHYGEARVTRVAADTRKRLEPWHAYDKHCPEHDGDDDE